jgi:Uma2 family endonuclease
VVDHATFRRWRASADVPEKAARICYLHGELWVDLSTEQYFWHNQVKTEITQLLYRLARDNRLGRFFSDGVLLTNTAAVLSCEPDGMFVSMESFEAERVWFVEGAKAGYLEMEGTPDMVLEVVSDSSVEKDTVTLLDLYHRAGVPEYWLVDAREGVRFDILRRTSKRYVATRKQKGWVKSSIFGRSFRLTEQADATGNPEYTLLVK